MLGKNTLRNAGYATALIIVLTLTGIFGSFENRFVLAETLSLSTVLLVGSLVIVGFIAAYPERERGTNLVFINALVGSLMVGGALAITVLVTSAIDMRFIFQNLGRLAPSPLTFGQSEPLTGAILLLFAAVIAGVVGGLLVYLPNRARDVLFITLSLTVVLGILQNQINNVIALQDALLVTVVFAIGYAAGRLAGGDAIPRRILIGGIVGLVIGVIVLVVFAPQGTTRILNFAASNAVLFLLLMAGVGMIGAIINRTAAQMHNAAWGFCVALLVLGLLNWQRDMTVLAAILTFLLIAGAQVVLPLLGANAETQFQQLSYQDRSRTRGVTFLGLMAVLIFVPPFAGLSITNTINLTALYVTMGIGLSVMIGYAGLLDLGYVASYAIGAYTIGLLTTPSLVTCGGLTPDQIAEQGKTLIEACRVLTFWEGLPLAVLVSAMTGMLLGVPVLRLRGDYLAIVTLGFGEIIQVLIKSSAFKPLLGGAQGIIQIPLPTINLTFLNPQWSVTLTKSTEVYYLYIVCVIVAAFIVLRLVNTRLGRAWRAMREDEDVAEAMGIHLVGTKLLAFGISSAFAGLGGAVFGASFQSIFPNSFTLLVSINVLSLIIIGGMGSIPGVMLGAFMLIGLPEVLRELQDYRLLVFGALLVTVMLLKPEGLIPPQPPKLAELARQENG